MKKRDLSVIAIIIIVAAFAMAAAIILECLKLPALRTILQQLLNY